MEALWMMTYHLQNGAALRIKILVKFQKSISRNRNASSTVDPTGISVAGTVSRGTQDGSYS